MVVVDVAPSLKYVVVFRKPLPHLRSSKRLPSRRWLPCFFFRRIVDVVIKKNRLRGAAVLGHGGSVGLSKVLGLTHLAVLLRY